MALKNLAAENLLLALDEFYIMHICFYYIIEARK